MAKPAPILDGYMRDSAGRLVPVGQVKAFVQQRDELVRDLVSRVREISDCLADAKARMLGDITAHIALVPGASTRAQTLSLDAAWPDAIERPEASADDHAHLHPAERADLARLIERVRYALDSAVSDLPAGYLGWIVEETLFQTGYLIRQGAPVAVPYLGIFEMGICEHGLGVDRYLTIDVAQSLWRAAHA